MVQNIFGPIEGRGYILVLAQIVGHKNLTGIFFGFRLVSFSSSDSESDSLCLGLLFLVRTFRLGLSFPLPDLSDFRFLSESESVAETNLGLDEELPDPENERDLERLKQENFIFKINLFIPKFVKSLNPRTALCNLTEKLSSNYCLLQSQICLTSVIERKLTKKMNVILSDRNEKSGF